MPKILSEEEWDRSLQLYAAVGPAAAAEELGIKPNTLNMRMQRRRLQGLDVPESGTPNGGAHPYPYRGIIQHIGRIELDLQDGTIMVGSDAHIWPERLEPWTTAMGAFLQLAEELQPDAVVLDGDVVDGATISRYPSIGWEKKPTMAEEIGASQEYLGDVVAVTPDARHLWPLGNHDLRFETRLATTTPEVAGIHGVHLKDHFPDWEPCWSVWVNPGPNPLVIKHRFKGGIHAAYMNTIYAGTSIATGHLHRLTARAFTDYNGTRYGVETGMLARVGGPQFVHYTEDNPVDWQSGFVVFTMTAGHCTPELVRVVDEDAGLFEFRGEIREIG